MAEGPTSGAQHSHIAGTGNIVVQQIGDNNQVNVAGLPHLALTTYQARRAAPKVELDLLDPFRRTVALAGRRGDLDALWAWLHSDRSIAVRTVKGRAGAGKTRIAVELIERLHAGEPGRWDAGFVTGREMARFAAQQNLSRWGWQRPTLVVVDYAATLVGHLNGWLHELADNERPGAPPLRVLLLEREASADAGWLRSLLDDSWSGAAVNTLFDPFEPVTMAPLDGPAVRRAVLVDAMNAAAALLGRPAPSVPPADADGVVRQSLEQPVWADPLYLMMAGLLAVGAGLPVVGALALSRTDLALKLADRELQRLDRFAAGDPNLPPLLKHLAACATLAGGLSADEAADVADAEAQALRRTCPGGPAAVADRAAVALARPAGGVAAVVPGIIGEGLFLRVLGSATAPDAGTAAVIRMARRHSAPVVASVIRSAQDYTAAGSDRPLVWLKALVQQGQADDLGLLLEIQNYLDEHVTQTLALREDAVNICMLLVVRFSKYLQDADDEGIRSELARFVNNLAVRLGAVGRREEALDRAAEAVALRRRLAAGRPDVFLSDLAMSLTNLAVRLSGVGRREEALGRAGEAVGLYRQLAADRPDAFLSDLATSLNNLAVFLGDVGRREEALDRAAEAMALRRRLAADRPDAFLPGLALSLTNLATRLGQIGHWEEALGRAGEAVGLYRQLAADRPDAFLPDLATSLNNLANVLGGVGRREEALDRAAEAADLYRQLAADRPDAFLPDLAMSLHNLANVLGDVGRREEALDRGAEAVAIRRRLAAGRPDAFLPDLAISLNNLASVLCGVGRREEALGRAAEAAGLYRQLAADRPDAFLPDLAMSLNNLANVLGGVGRREEALDRAAEAADLYRRLAADRPDALLPDLGTALSNLAMFLGDVGRWEEAQGKAVEAVAIRRQLATARPDAFLPELAQSLAVLGRCLRGIDRHADAAHTLCEAAMTLRPLFRRLPVAFAPLMMAIVREYLQSATTAQVEADGQLVTEVTQVLEQLKAAKPQTGG